MHLPSPPAASALRLKREATPFGISPARHLSMTAATPRRCASRRRSALLRALYNSSKFKTEEAHELANRRRPLNNGANV